MLMERGLVLKIGRMLKLESTVFQLKEKKVMTSYKTLEIQVKHRVGYTLVVRLLNLLLLVEMI